MSQDHPRPCGEKVTSLSRTALAKGSPPPMRGKGWNTKYKSCAARITPAHAGKRALNTNSSQHVRDHPRPCGEKLKLNDKTIAQMGSPPPMRGKGPDKTLSFSCIRITPAHAGKSTIFSVVVTFTGDHPRPCGEKFESLPDVATTAGSPPPMRGKVSTPPPMCS